MTSSIQEKTRTQSLATDSPWALEGPTLLDIFEVTLQDGLSQEQVESRQAQYGTNTITTQKPPSWLTIFIRQFKNLLVGLLAVSAIVAGITGDVLDAIAILLVLAVNSLIGFVTEVRAVTSMESLRKMGQTLSRVLRKKGQTLISSTDLVPGDILLFEAGDVITADCRIIESHNLYVDESALTGESVPVEKAGELILEPSTGISGRQNMLMKGTHITKGVCKAVVTSIGMNTELGKIATLTTTAKEEITPLEQRLDRLGRKLLWLTLIVSVLILVSGLLTGKDPIVMLQTAIALAVATVPEGLPIVATIALAKGLWTMANKNALINRLSAVETLGATSIIVTDKTGTLTENKMTVSEIVTDEGLFKIKGEAQSKRLKIFTSDGQPLSFSSMGSSFRRFVEVAGLCNDAQYGSSEMEIGDPMEIALLRFAVDTIDGEFSLTERYPRIYEVPFDSKTRMMATLHRRDSQIFVAAKGAPEALLSRCTLDEEQKIQWLRKNDELAAKSLRVLAIAYKVNHQESEDVFTDLTFLGLVGLLDPARHDVPNSISQCQKAGIRVIMATGDQSGTAVKIASEIGLPHETLQPISGMDLSEPWSEELVARLQKTSIFSRVSPEQKLRLVEHFQKQGAVVAMTGDGVNDAPALKKADIGVAMGLRGTQVAREASDMILKDDRFETIVFAIEQGRIIYSNIRKFVIYLLSCNISEVFVVGLASIFSSKLPITPLQILFLNLVTDVFPALALGMGRGDSTYLSKPPRGFEEKILEKPHWYFIFFYGGLITAIVLGLFYYCTFWLRMDADKVVTMSFLTLGLSQVFHVFNLKKSGSSYFSNEITNNPYVWAAVVFCIILFFGSVQVPFVQFALNLVPLTIFEWLVVFGCSFVPFLGQLVVRLK
ncbi:MAG: cation-transporting P-type ATPase [Bdellovibrionales bacterium]|nr:cation-transporting P-type ATPase [Bdellovibrionales bacterium]